MTTRINDEDIEYLHSFPDRRKEALMRKIMAREPEQSVVVDGETGFEKTMLRLHRDGFGLIDLQPQESAFSTVWYRKCGPLPLPWIRSQVAMLLWQAQEDGDSTTLMTWRV